MSAEQQTNLPVHGITEAISPVSDSRARYEPQPVETQIDKFSHGQRGPMDLRIDELVLQGFSPGDRYRISEAIESELTRLLAESGLPALLSNDGELTNIDGGSIQIGTDTRPAAIGIRVAQSIYRGLTR